MRTSELIGPALNWAVVKASGQNADYWLEKYASEDRRCMCEAPSIDWSQGGPIIEREGIELLCNLTTTEAARFSAPGVKADWQAFHRSDRRTEARQFAATPLVAAMRCYVASKLGDVVEIPEELK